MNRLLIDKLADGASLTRHELKTLILDDSPETTACLAERANAAREQVYGRKVFIRGLIEFTNYCKNDCYYCGIRKSNRFVSRYRLSEAQILDCCQRGYALGFRTFVLQGGEDPYWTDERTCRVVSAIRRDYPDCAITLSMGERSRESYQRLFDAGADRYLLRHETADPEHYGRLHPAGLTLAHRLDCLRALKEIGFQTGCGFMVGSPGQTADQLVSDLCLIRDFKPEMVGIGPFLPAAHTPFEGEPAGSSELTIKLLSMVRLLHPRVLLPATTALGTAERDGRERGIQAGANVIMPNLSPLEVREKYLLYDGKIATGDEAAESIRHLSASMEKISYEIVSERGDYLV